MLINLHSHLEGRLRPATALELAREVGLPTPRGGWAEALHLDGPADLTVYLAKVAATYPFFATADHLARITREAVEDAAADGGDYLELRFGPATHVRAGLPIDTVVRAVCEGAAEGVAGTAMPCGIVVAALRHHDEDTNREVARVAARHAGRGVVGFDLAGDELLHPDLGPFREPFSIARAAGLGLTCHAAEAAPAGAARAAVDLLGVARIGHGTHVADDPDAIRWAADSGIVIEVCPTSNWYTGAIPHLGAHPVRTFQDAGVALVLGDDNPIQTGSPLSTERAVLAGRHGFSPAELTALDRRSIEAAFLDDSLRRELADRLDAAPDHF
jgi:adenosine deaminase